MRLVEVRKGESRAGDRLIDQAHVLRARVFHQRLGWDVDVDDGRERDEYDALGPTYILATTEDFHTVIGTARLLPGDGPTMLANTFPFLLDGNPIAPQGRLVESSRFCVDTASGAGASARGLHLATMTLFAGILEWSLANGFADVATVTDLRFERILARAGLPFHRLGSPQAIGNTMAIAGIIPATAANALRVRPIGYRPFCANQTRIAA